MDAADEFKMILETKKLKQQEQEDKQTIKSPRADKKKEEDTSKHRRKGVPLKSLRPLFLPFEPSTLPSKPAGEGAEEPTSADVPTGGASNAAPAPSADESGVVFRVVGGVRRRKPAAPARSL